MLTGSQIRRKFLDFFVQKGHKEVHSSSLVPANDPTLLFTNAGMNQFKDVFLGLEKRDYSRATTSQKCVRAGGKHNDLENVGFTNRHHTFFEMLGNFSFGDYFKKDAIAYAWELVTSPEWFGIDKSKLYVTVFHVADRAAASWELGFDLEQGAEHDSEAERYWLDVGVPRERIFPGGTKDNFWQMGDVGPCGPCSEIHYDMGPAASDAGHTNCAFPCDCGRYVEVWNLVFMQYDRQPGGTTRLPKPSIDTGMGLERIAAVLQGVISNYDTDLFTPLIERAAELTLGKAVGLTRDAGLRIIADHSRASAFLISDGVLPSNEGRGYVLRKIMRRGIRHGWLLGQRSPFFYRMVDSVYSLMKDAYPELQVENVAAVIRQEETLFGHTTGVGLTKLEAELAPLLERKQHSQGEQIYPGEQAFKLYDTFGLSLDFIQDTCRDFGVTFDHAGFDRAMEEQKSRARASWKGAAKQTANPAYQQLPKSVFEGYFQTRSDGCEVLAIVKNGQGAQELEAGESGEVILDHTPFYADSGGQVGDKGWFYSDDHNTIVAEVTGCYAPIQGVRAHQVVVKSPPKSPPNENRVGWGTLSGLKVGDRVDAVVNAEIRESTMRNHTATHLLHAGLREVLGKHVKQAGSLVAPDYLRFDFSHFTAVEDEELQDIEDIINKEVLRNIKVETLTDVPIDEAINTYHAMALFGEKYGEKVRVVRIGDFSTELCGGTHTGATGEIGLIKILKEGSVSSGVRRVEAVTGTGSLAHFRKDHELEKVVHSVVAPSLIKGDGKSKTPPSPEGEGWGTREISPAEALRLELEKNKVVSK